MKKFRLIFLLSIVLVAIGIMPSQVLGKNTLTIVAEKEIYETDVYGNKYTHEDIKYNMGNDTYLKGNLKYDSGLSVYTPPIVDISMEYDEVVIYYSGDKMEDSLKFKLKGKDNFYIGKYILEIDRNEKKVIFRKIGMTSNAEEYMVSPYKNNDDSYFQAGAVYFDGTKDMGYTAPIYNILAEETMCDSGWVNRIQLGNSHTITQSFGTLLATHPSCYVFCDATQKTEKDIYHFSEGQVESKATIKIGEDTYTVTDTQEAGKFIPREKDGLGRKAEMTSIVYTLSGINSGVMDQEKATGLESILAKIGIGVGDLFLSAIRGCLRSC